MAYRRVEAAVDDFLSLEMQCFGSGVLGLFNNADRRHHLRDLTTIQVRVDDRLGPSEMLSPPPPPRSTGRHRRAMGKPL